jgi:hypothetical protein
VAELEARGLLYILGVRERSDKLVRELALDDSELEEDDEPFTADAEGLRRFLEGEVLPWFEARMKELASRSEAGSWASVAP